MQYEIKGTPFPVVVCQLAPNESMYCQKGAMAWMSPNMLMQTSGNGIGKMFSRAFMGESMFRNTYTAQKTNGEIAFASTVPGCILPIHVTPSRPIVAQKRAYLASETSIDLNIFFQQRLGAGFFGGEGFIMQQLSGNGMAFLEIDGSIVEYDLNVGQSILVDTGYLAAMDATCSISIEQVAGIGNKLFGGEGFFNTRITGPGHVWLQTMPMNVIAGAMAPFVPHS